MLTAHPAHCPICSPVVLRTWHTAGCVGAGGAQACEKLFAHGGMQPIALPNKVRADGHFGFKRHETHLAGFQLQQAVDAQRARLTRLCQQRRVAHQVKRAHYVELLLLDSPARPPFKVERGVRRGELANSGMFATSAGVAARSDAQGLAAPTTMPSWFASGRSSHS